MLITACIGCAAEPSRLRITDYPSPGSVRTLSGSFEEGYYRIDAAGNLDLILRHAADPDAKAAADQVVHVSTVWRSIPGQTAADETQINGTVVYAILGPGVDSTYEGAGSVFFSTDPMTGAFTGRLNRVILRPKRQLAEGPPLFERVQISGAFHADLDPRKTVQTINDLERQFGPRTP
jgi:hypothetical protein